MTWWHNLFIISAIKRNEHNFFLLILLINFSFAFFFRFRYQKSLVLFRDSKSGIAHFCMCFLNLFKMRWACGRSVCLYVMLLFGGVTLTTPEKKLHLVVLSDRICALDIIRDINACVYSISFGDLNHEHVNDLDHWY